MGKSAGVEFLPSLLTFEEMKATLTSKGQITIPIEIRRRVRLAPGDVLDFDETANFLKATKAVDPGVWEKFGEGWEDPMPKLSTPELLDELRGKVRLPKR